MKHIVMEKEAAADAAEWLGAEMFYGDGAGVRRKLVKAMVQTKDANIEGYQEAFDKAYAALDKNKFAEMAIKERKRIDAGVKTGKNMRALKSGNIRGLSNGLFVVVAVGYGLHVTGYDKVLVEQGKKLYRKAKIEATVWQNKGADVINLIKETDE